MLTKAKIKYFKSLQQKKCREEEKCYIVEGIKIVNEAILYHSKSIIQIICTENSVDSLHHSIRASIEIVDQETINKISSLTTPQACLAVLQMHESPEKDSPENNNIVLALESIRDPGNLGTIIRLADWYGITQIICSDDSVDCYNPKVVQASMGALLRVKIQYYNMASYLSKARDNNIKIYGATLEGEDIYTSSIKFPSIILMGNESNGISATSRKFLTNELLIPNFSLRKHKTESLNVSSATSIIISEFIRRRNYSK